MRRGLRASPRASAEKDEEEDDEDEEWAESPLSMCRRPDDVLVRFFSAPSLFFLLAEDDGEEEKEGPRASLPPPRDEMGWFSSSSREKLPADRRCRVERWPPPEPSRCAGLSGLSGSTVSLSSEMVKVLVDCRVLTARALVGPPPPSPMPTLRGLLATGAAAVPLEPPVSPYSSGSSTSSVKVLVDCRVATMRGEMGLPRGDPATEDGRSLALGVSPPLPPAAALVGVLPDAPPSLRGRSLPRPEDVAWDRGDDDEEEDFTKADPEGGRSSSGRGGDSGRNRGEVRRSSCVRRLALPDRFNDDDEEEEDARGDDDDARRRTGAAAEEEESTPTPRRLPSEARPAVLGLGRASADRPRWGAADADDDITAAGCFSRESAPCTSRSTPADELRPSVRLGKPDGDISPPPEAEPEPEAVAMSSARVLLEARAVAPLAGGSLELGRLRRTATGEGGRAVLPPPPPVLLLAPEGPIVRRGNGSRPRTAGPDPPPPDDATRSPPASSVSSPSGLLGSPSGSPRRVWAEEGRGRSPPDRARGPGDSSELDGDAAPTDTEADAEDVEEEEEGRLPRLRGEGPRRCGPAWGAGLEKAPRLAPPVRPRSDAGRSPGEAAPGVDGGGGRSGGGGGGRA